MLYTSALQTVSADQLNKIFCSLCAFFLKIFHITVFIGKIFIGSILLIYKFVSHCKGSVCDIVYILTQLCVFIGVCILLCDHFGSIFSSHYCLNGNQSIVIHLTDEAVFRPEKALNSTLT